MSRLGSAKLTWVLLTAGVVLRLGQYLFNRSLWLDECFLALNILEKPFGELFQPLDNRQFAPIGFLLLERIASRVLGDSEYVLRLVPLLSGIGSLFLLHTVAKRWIGAAAANVALGLLAVCEPLIYYSSEVKQYSTDAAVTLLLCFAATFVSSGEPANRRIVWLGIATALGLCLSFTAGLVVAGFLGALAVIYLFERRWSALWKLSLAYTLCGLVGLFFYFGPMRDLLTNERMLGGWSFAYAPFPPRSFVDFRWYDETLIGLLHDPVGLHFGGMGAVAFIVGCFSLYSRNKRSFLLIAGPMVAAFLASALDTYPLAGRQVIFMVPLILLLVGEGAATIKEKTAGTRAVGTTFLVLLFFHPTLWAGYHLVHPRQKEEIKPAMEHIAKHRRDGDVLYIYHMAGFAFRYYSPRYGLQDAKPVMGIQSRRDWDQYIPEIESLKGNDRVWVLFSHDFRRRGKSEERFFISRLNKMGKRLDALKAKGASVYLYDLDEP